MVDQNSQCSNITPLLDAFHDNELPQSERTQVAAHLETCQTCQVRLKEIDKLVTSLKTLSRAKMPHELKLDWSTIAAQSTDEEQEGAEDLAATLPADKSNVVQIKSRSLFALSNPLMLSAAALVLLVLTALIFQVKPGHQSLLAVRPNPEVNSSSTKSPGHTAPLIARNTSTVKSSGGAQQVGNGDLLALYSNDSSLVSEELGIETDEDGLYALKM